MDVVGVEAFAWNPLRARWFRYTRIRRHMNNFGDLLGPIIVRHMVERLNLSAARGDAGPRLFSVGSVLHFAETGDIVWGSGVNGKVPASWHRFDDLDVRAVRGPHTRAYLAGRGIAAPAIYGDPALLLPWLRPDLVALSEHKRHRLTVVPNLNDRRTLAPRRRLLSPQRPVETCLRRIVQSEFVTGSSLHAIIVAEAFGVPARLIAAEEESDLKYRDHYEGTGRGSYAPAESVDEALRRGGEPPLEWSPQPLIDAFPRELWRPDL